jgi:hypothetical protein
MVSIPEEEEEVSQSVFQPREARNIRLGGFLRE